MIEELLKTGLIAFGGFAYAKPIFRPRYSIIGHWDADHVTADESIHIFAALNPPRRLDNFVASRSYTLMSFGRAMHICRMDEARVYTRPLGDRDLKKMGISHRFHRSSPSKSTVPIRIVAVGGLKKREEPETEIVVYLDDYDVDDINNIMKLAEQHREEFGDRFRGMLIPVYAGTRGHGAGKPEDLSNTSREVVTTMLETVDLVGVLIHSPKWYPAWLTELRAEHNFLEFLRTLKVLEELPEYRNRHNFQ